MPFCKTLRTRGLWVIDATLKAFAAGAFLAATASLDGRAPTTGLGNMAQGSSGGGNRHHDDATAVGSGIRHLGREP